MKKNNHILFLLLLLIISLNLISQRNPFKFNFNNNSDTHFDSNIKVLGSGKIKNGAQFVVLTDGNITKSVCVGRYFGEYKVISITNFEVTLSDSEGKIKKVEIKKPFNLGQAEGLGGEQHYDVLLV